MRDYVLCWLGMVAAGLVAVQVIGRYNAWLERREARARGVRLPLEGP